MSFSRTKLRSGRSAFLLCGCLLVARCGFGLERVVLSNGFSVDCHHRGQAQDGRVRLFLNVDESSYLDVERERIRSAETIELPAVEVANEPTTPTNAKSSGVSVDALIAEQGAVHRLDVNLLKSVVNAESGGRASAVSHAGAQGLMQLMPGTARALGVQDSFAPDQNLQGGTTYLDQLLVRYHDDLLLALAAYNAGPAAVDRYHGIPPYRETRAYVARIVREFNRRSLLARRAAAALVPTSR